MQWRNAIGWLPFGLVLLLGLTMPAEWPHWVFMWFIAAALFFSCKWLTWWTVRTEGVAVGRQLGYWFAWPGFDAGTFFWGRSFKPTSTGEWLFAFVKLGFGVAVVLGVYTRFPIDLEYTRGWIGMIGIAFILHFGVFHLMSLAWRSAGVAATHIMDWPILAASGSDFWGRRWNKAFRDLTHRFLFRPLTVRFGGKPALVVGFFFSGLVHEIVISWPAGSGYGGPTLFFLLQAAAILFERSWSGRQLGLGHGLIGWSFTAVVLVGPVFLLFHPPFLRMVVAPFLDWVTGIGGES
jgi:hypothetical protein